MSAKEQLAIEAARRAFVEVYKRDGFVWSQSGFMEAFMLGVAWARSDAAKLLDGVVRARDIGEGG